MQISLCNYDPQKDKRFNGSFRLPIAPRPQLKVCMLGSEDHNKIAKELGLDVLVSIRRKEPCSGGRVGAKV